MEYVIFLNGLYPKDEQILELLDNKILICADGGANVAKRLGLTPNYIIGDLDSISLDTLEYYKSINVPIIKQIKEKDYTDFENCLMFIEYGFIPSQCNRDFSSVLHFEKNVLVFGATGKRIDMTLSNLKVIESNPSIKLITEEGEQVFVISDNTELRYKNRTISIIPISDSTISLKGFKYTLDNVKIKKETSLACNIQQDDVAYIYISGRAYVIIEPISE